MFSGDSFLDVVLEHLVDESFSLCADLVSFGRRELERTFFHSLHDFFVRGAMEGWEATE